MSEAKDSKPFFSEHVKAMGRLGLAELRNALYPDSNVAQQHAEQGIYGTKTQGEVAEGRRAESPTQEVSPEKGSILGDRLKQAETREPPEPDGKGLERE